MSQDKIDLSIVIPCFNEAKNVTLVLDVLKKSIQESTYGIEVIVVDGASTDNTPNELRELFKTLPENNFKLILNEKRGGYGGDIIKALNTARGEVLAWTHADMQTDPNDVLMAHNIWKTRQPQDLLVKGKRQNRALLETIFTFGMQLVASAALGVPLDDINAQPKLFSRAFYEEQIKNDPPTDFSLDLFLLYKAQICNLPIETLPVVFAKRQHGEAKGGGSWKTRLKLIKRTFAYIFELRRKVRQNA